MNQQQMDDLARYLPDDEREYVHSVVAPCSPDEFVRRYAHEYGCTTLRECAALAGVSEALEIAIGNPRCNRCGRELEPDQDGEPQPCPCGIIEAHAAPAGYTLPDGWTWPDVAAQRAKYGIGAKLLPLESAGGAVAWGVPTMADSDGIVRPMGARER